MKIVLITSFFPPTHTAGTEKRTFGYARQLQARGHEVQVVCAGAWEEGDRYWNGYTDDVYCQIPVRRIHLNWRLAADPNQFLYRNPIIKEKVAQWFARWKPDVVHVTSCLTLSASVIQAAQEQRLPVVLTLTDYWFICPRISLLRADGSLCTGRTRPQECLECLMAGSKIYRGLKTMMPPAAAAASLKWLSRHAVFSKRRGLRGMALDMVDRKEYLAKMINAAGCVTAPSAYLRQLFHASGLTVPIQVIPSGHDLGWLANMPPKKPARLKRIGYIGQIIPTKGVHTLLAAFISANLAGQAHLFIFGSYGQNPAYRRQLEQLAAGQEGIKFCGPFPHDQLGNVLAQLDVLVTPSVWHENNPRVIQEAFAGKTPVIASDVGGIAEFVQHGVNGLLFERGNAADLAGQIRRIVTEPGLLERLQAGIPPVRTMDEEMDEIEQIYQRLVLAVKS